MSSDTRHARLKPQWTAVTLLALFALPAIAHDLDLRRLPLGDGKISTEPKTGWIWACRIDPQAGGAFRAGPWIDQAAGTWDQTRKVAVGGAVNWPHELKITREGDKRVVTTK